ncbi:MAG TPA: RluA family pseudouridine synthase [Saprospiraceae bacterium]|nr:RluA family pseudouridine synthase [Saprospiraceae bacterium]
MNLEQDIQVQKDQIVDESEFEVIQFAVDPGQGPLRLDHFLNEKIPKVSRNKIQNAITAGMITVNQKPTKSNYKIRPLDVIDVVFPRFHENEDIIPENIPLDILFEDDDILLVNKKPGMVVHPAGGNSSGTLVNALAGYFGIDPNLEKKPRYGLVHRIDKETSGILIVAKTDFAHVALSKQFYDHTIEREYIALVWGDPEPSSGTIVGNVGRDPKNRQRMFVFEDGTEGKHAVTHYELIESFYYASLIKCRLETGRTHQIRVHMKFIGHPLFNDERYGGDRIVKGTVFTKYKQFVQNCFKLMPRFALHARSLGFIHPVTGKKMFLEIEPPEDFTQLVEKWRHYLSFRKDKVEEAESEEQN